jgi:DMSO/TMAO reductase YedYZ molybdopterin-dependent catalytic subunit
MLGGSSLKENNIFNSSRHSLLLLAAGVGLWGQLVAAPTDPPVRPTGPLRRHNARPLDAESDLSMLVPWETPIEGFFIRNHNEIPVVDTERWILVIDGLVNKPLTLTLKDLRAFPNKSLHAVLEISGNGRASFQPKVPGVQWENGAVGNAEWTGVALADVLERAGVKPEARYLRVEGADKPALPSLPAFIRSVPIARAMEKDSLLAWDMNRQPMPVLHGGPLRLVLPRWYGESWMKFVTNSPTTCRRNRSPIFAAT